MSGLVNGETLATSGVTGGPVLGMAAVVGSGAGNYPISVEVGGMSAGNYSISGASGVLVVTKVPLLVRAEDTRRIAGVLSPALTAYTVSGFVNGETLATGGVRGSPVLGTAAVVGSLPGSYAITVDVGGMSADNYTFAGVGGVLTTEDRWRLAATGVPFAARNTGGMAEYNGRMWVLGGWTLVNGVQQRSSDVWSSGNGTNWVMATGQAPWSGRNEFGVAGFGGRLWVLGGTDGAVRNDVWSSVDGAVWTQETGAAGWSGRYGFGCVVFQNQLWVLGGRGPGGGLSDVWSSADGRAWTRVRNNAPWGGRAEFCCAAFGGRLWVYGGEILGTGFVNDVWSSANGVDWVRETAAAGWGPRKLAVGTATTGRLWLVGGYPATFNGAGLQDAWWSDDGRVWQPDLSQIPWGARYGAMGVGYQDRVWLVDGVSGTTFRNDVWYASGSFPPVLVSGGGSGDLTKTGGLASYAYGTGLTVGQLGLSNNLPGTYGLSPASGSVLPAGTQTVSVVFTPTDPSYLAVTGQVVVTVTKAALVVRADDKARTYGAANPELTYTVSGFVNGETLATSGVTGSPVLGTAAGTGSAPGSYPITVDVAGMSGRNYEITSRVGSLEVFLVPSITLPSIGSTNLTLDDLRITAVVTGSPAPVIQWFKDGSPLGDGEWITGTTTTNLDLSAITFTDGGQYRLTASNRYGVATSEGYRLAVRPRMLYLEIGSVTNVLNSTVAVPLRVRGFTNISSLQFTIQWDASVMSYAGLLQAGLPMLGSANLGEELAPIGLLPFSWDSSEPTGYSVDDGTAIMTVLFRILPAAAPGGRAVLNFSDNPSILESLDSRGGAFDVMTSAGSVAISSIAISGVVRDYANRLPVPGAVVVLDGATSLTNTTDSSGRYQFVMDPTPEFSLRVAKSNDFPANSGVSSADISLIRKSVLGIRPLGSIFNAIAADVDLSGSVSTADISYIRRLVLGVTNTLPAGLWRFFPADVDLTGVSAPPISSFSKIISNPVGNLDNVDFFGAKLGDVNGSWSPPAVAATVSKSLIPTGGSLGDQAILVIDTVVGGKGDIVRVKVMTGACTNLSSIQFSIGWNTNLLRYLGVGDFGIAGVGSPSFGPLTPLEVGRLTFSWDDGGTPNGIFLTNGSILFSMQFEILESASPAFLSFISSPTPVEVGFLGGLGQVVSVNGAVVSGTGVVAMLQPSRVVVGVGGGIGLNCLAQGGVLRQYQWRKNGIPIVGQTNDHIALTNVVLETAGRYSVLALDEAGVPVASIDSLVLVVAPTRLLAPAWSGDSTFSISFGSVGSEPIGSDRLAQLVVQGCGDLTMGQWRDLSVARFLTNGVVQFSITNQTDQPTWFYRVLER